jgi:hypothetical protein
MDDGVLEVSMFKLKDWFSVEVEFKLILHLLVMIIGSSRADEELVESIVVWILA